MLQKLILFFTCLLSSMGIGQTGSAEPLTQSINVSIKPITYYVDGQKDTTGNDSGYFFNGNASVPNGIIYSGTTYVPLRYFSERLKKEVGWDPQTESIWIGKKPDRLSPVHAVLTQISASTGDTKINIAIVPYTFYFDGQKEQTTAIPGYFNNGVTNVPKGFSYKWTTYVPLRYLSEGLNKEVGWDPQTRSIWVGMKPNSFEPAPSSNLVGIYGVGIGQSSDGVIQTLGKPNRVEPSALGYEWWIYNSDLSNYVQVGMKDNKVVDLYSNAATWSYRKVKVGANKESLQQLSAFHSTVAFHYDQANFSLTNNQPERLLYLVNGTPVIIYLDKYNADKVTGIRFQTTELLVKGKSFAMNCSYSGNPPDMEAPTLSKAQQQAVQTGNERQILDLTNVSRLRNGLTPLTWNEAAAQVGRNHSLDMAVHHFFDHVSATTGLDPFQRMKKAGISFHAAGENIAEGYFDGIEAHAGWMNSLGHRENILNRDFTTLGVGAVGMDYSQEFVTP